MRRLLISLVLASLLSVGLLATASAAEKSPKVFKPQSQPRGLSYSEWQVRWFQWQFETAEGIEAALDETGASCTAGLQPKRVWFSTFVTHDGTTTRSCRAPHSSSERRTFCGKETVLTRSRNATHWNGLPGSRPG